MEFAALELASATSDSWIRFGVILAVSSLALCLMRSAMIRCTVVGVCVSGFAASFVENEQLAMLILVVGLSLGPFVGVIIETINSRERRTQSVIGRRLARQYVCPQCGNQFSSIQAVGQCPQCECRFTAPGQAT